MKNSDTYTTTDYQLLSIIPAPPGWRAVFWNDGKTGEIGLDVYPLHFLAVAKVTDTRRRTTVAHHSEVLGTFSYTDVVGVIYWPSDGFDVADGNSNFCGLCPPGQDPAEVTYGVTDYVAYDRAKAAYLAKSAEGEPHA